MRLQERPLGDPGGGPSGQEGYGGSPKSLLPPKVANVSADIIKKFSHTKRVGNYLLGKTLGEGSFAKVKEGLHTLTGEKVSRLRVDLRHTRNLVSFILLMITHALSVCMFNSLSTCIPEYLICSFQSPIPQLSAEIHANQ